MTKAPDPIDEAIAVIRDESQRHSQMFLGLITGRMYDLTDPAQAQTALMVCDATINDVRRAGREREAVATG